MRTKLWRFATEHYRTWQCQQLAERIKKYRVSRSCRGRFADYSASESTKEFFPILTRIERKVSGEFGFLMR
jgi:hypothetical protein